VRVNFEFDFHTRARPEDVIGLMVDFSPARPNRWPKSSAKAFEVYHVGETDAEIREGQDFPKIWARWHYEWFTPGSVTMNVVESDALVPGSLMTMTAVPATDGGSDVHVVWDNASRNASALLGVVVMRFFGPRLLSSYFKKVFDGLAG
jgi:hypothetical protein